MTYYTTTHKNENLQALVGELLDPCTTHMVFDAGYDLEVMRDIITSHPWKVIWVMERNSQAKFGWAFKELAGIPR